MGILYTTWNKLLDLIFPSSCLSCGKSGETFCLNCLSLCPRAERESADWILPLYDYRDKNIKNAIWLFKYKNKTILAKIFSEVLYDYMLMELSDLKIMENFTQPLLIPIPISGKRKRERGFNQAELISKNLVLLDQSKNFILVKDVLHKPKDSVHQARLKDRNVRLKNLKGSFLVENGEKIKGRNIILIDDVTTTGATLAEAKKVLRGAGARKIIAFTVAH